MPTVDATLIAEMFDRHAAALALYASQWTSAAEDCVQEALVELARQPVAPDNPTAWLYRVVRNRALNAARSARRRLAHERAAAEAWPARRPVPPDPATTASIADSLAALEASAREIVVLRVWGGLAWQEIAELVGGSKSAAQRHYIQALEQLRKLGEPPIMSDELRLPDDLAACEARLAAQSLPASGINRDELMYRAGWAAGVETTRLAALASPPFLKGARGGIRLAVASLTSAAVAASLAVAATLQWRPAEIRDVAASTRLETALPAEPEAASVSPIQSNNVHAERRLPGIRSAAPLDIGLVRLRRLAMTGEWPAQASVASNGDRTAAGGKTSRELLEELIPSDQPNGSLLWPWNNASRGKSI